MIDALGGLSATRMYGTATSMDNATKALREGKALNALQFAIEHRFDRRFRVEVDASRSSTEQDVRLFVYYPEGTSAEAVFSVRHVVVEIFLRHHLPLPVIIPRARV